MASRRVCMLDVKKTWPTNLENRKVCSRNRSKMCLSQEMRCREPRWQSANFNHKDRLIVTRKRCFVIISFNNWYFDFVTFHTRSCRSRNAKHSRYTINSQPDQDCRSLDCLCCWLMCQYISMRTSFGCSFMVNTNMYYQTVNAHLW